MLQSAAPISMTDIFNEFAPDADLPLSLTDFYRGGEYVPDIPENTLIPKTGDISLTDFYGSTKRRVIEFTFIPEAKPYDRSRTASGRFRVDNFIPNFPHVRILAESITYDTSDLGETSVTATGLSLDGNDTDLYILNEDSITVNTGMITGTLITMTAARYEGEITHRYYSDDPADTAPVFVRGYQSEPSNPNSDTTVMAGGDLGGNTVVTYEIATQPAELDPTSLGDNRIFRIGSSNEQLLTGGNKMILIGTAPNPNHIWIDDEDRKNNDGFEIEFTSRAPGRSGIGGFGLLGTYTVFDLGDYSFISGQTYEIIVS